MLQQWHASTNAWHLPVAENSTCGSSGTVVALQQVVIFNKVCLAATTLIAHATVMDNNKDTTAYQGHDHCIRHKQV